MSNLGRAILELREERGMTQGELAALVGMADHSAIAKRERGEVRVKPVEWKKFAAAFGMSVDEFNERWRGTKIDQVRGAHGIPIINAAPAGQTVNYEEYGTDSGQGYEYIDWGSVTDDLAFAVRVVGDSMEPTMREGDTVVFSPMNRPRPPRELADGAVVLVRFSDATDRPGCTLARFFWEPDRRHFRLVKDNRKYPMARWELVPDVIARISVAIELRKKDF
jgi:transcriptional regulator with XRE-family HTH domain